MNGSYETGESRCDVWTGPAVHWISEIKHGKILTEQIDKSARNASVCAQWLHKLMAPSLEQELDGWTSHDGNL